MKSILLIGLLLAGCSLSTPLLEPQPSSTWMVTRVSGGQQCDPRIEFNPPNIKLSLEEDGIAFLEYIEVSRAVCRACNCPSYSKDHYVLVRNEDIERVAHFGFEVSEKPPPS